MTAWPTAFIPCASKDFSRAVKPERMGSDGGTDSCVGSARPLGVGSSKLSREAGAESKAAGALWQGRCRNTDSGTLSCYIWALSNAMTNLLKVATWQADWWWPPHSNRERLNLDFSNVVEQGVCTIPLLGRDL